MRKSCQALVEEADAIVGHVTVDEARGLLGRDDTLFIDLRDIRELKREGRIPGAFHCPRGLLEFWIDPDSPYHKPVFTEEKRFVFFCGGGWRSALAARSALEMGLEPVTHLKGGFSEWREAGAPVEREDGEKAS
ncbi:MAG: rhodanese-like domain-containing protein [Hyphomicrobiaceae bacterium]|nr:rhodanese-like domain-containing protein [Hyphomicrobiaceae bacterium]